MNELEQMIEEYRAAWTSYRQALQNLDWAEPDFIDLAIADVSGSEFRIGQALKRIKLLKGVGKVA